MQETITIKNHPQKRNVEGLPLEQCRNLRQACEGAVTIWKNSKKSSAEEKEFNVNYFRVYMELADNRIKELTKNEN